MMKVMAEIDETEYGLLCTPCEVKPLMEALNHVYGMIWTAACYDPDNEHTQALAQRLLPYIQKANEILQFKK